MGHTEVFVTDPVASRALYERIGFAHQETQGGLTSGSRREK